VERPELESALWVWFLRYENDGHISRELIREKAKRPYLLCPTDELPMLKFLMGDWMSLNWGEEFGSTSDMESQEMQI